ncbi:hypothetical protein EGW08_021364 [Elysia chlorotica]|uniref:Uncharacterized protein n=1 Tax=Elysia chlorotica TaxID=188477 RepID=A0A433SNU2_ELYCH|nr:hypothetical protein EGW08_021364 [Elysia chlorotica]
MRLSLVMETQAASSRRLKDQVLLSPFRQENMKTADKIPGPRETAMGENPALTGQYSGVSPATHFRPKPHVSLSTQISFYSPASSTPIPTRLCPVDRNPLIPSYPRPGSKFNCSANGQVVDHSVSYPKLHLDDCNPTDICFNQGVPTRKSAISHFTENDADTLLFPISNSVFTYPKDSYTCTPTYCLHSRLSHPIDKNTFTPAVALKPYSVVSLSPESNKSNTKLYSYAPDPFGKDVHTCCISCPVAKHIVPSVSSCHYDLYSPEINNFTHRWQKQRLDFGPTNRQIPAVPFEDRNKSYVGAYPHPCSDLLCPVHPANRQIVHPGVSYLADRKDSQ